MTNSYGSLIQQLKNLMDKLTTDFGALATLTQNIDASQNSELQKVLDGIKLQNNYTGSTNNLLTPLPIDANATLANLMTAINLVQLYFQGTQSFPQISSNLLGNLPNTFNDAQRDAIRTSTQQVLDDRTTLQKALNRVLREFDSEISEKSLESLVQQSRAILSALDPLKKKSSLSLNDLSPISNNFISHLKQAGELFKSFNRKSEDLTGSEPNQIKQLVLNWGEAIRTLEELEKDDGIKQELGTDVKKSRTAIAQSIQLRNLLETNYDYLTALVRSGDLESAGIL